MAKRCVEYEITDSVCRLGEVLLAFASGLLTMVTFGTPYWMVKEPEVTDLVQEEYHLGLWQNCTFLGSCRTLPVLSASVPAYLLITRIFMSLSLVAGVCSWLVCIIALIQQKSRWLFLSAIIYSFQGFALMLGLASFSRAYHDTPDAHASWSYSVGWIAFLFTLVCASYFILIAVFRMRKPRTLKGIHNSQQSTYTPLAQFEESSDSSEGDDKL